MNRIEDDKCRFEITTKPIEDIYSDRVFHFTKYITDDFYKNGIIHYDRGYILSNDEIDKLILFDEEE